MQLDDETLMAFADDELAPEDTARIEALIAGDPALAAKVARLRDVRQRVHAAYAPVLDEPTPDRLLAMLAAPAEESSNVASLDAARARRAQRFGPPAWAAIAASLVLGVIVGRGVAPQADLRSDDGAILAGAALERVLNERLASAEQTGPTRVGFSFRTNDGRTCRTFAQHGDASTLSGLACREDEGWAIQVAVQEHAETSEYRQAGASAPAVLEAVDALIAGEPLNAAQEEESRAQGWR